MSRTVNRSSCTCSFTNSFAETILGMENRRDPSSIPLVRIVRRRNRICCRVVTFCLVFDFSSCSLRESSMHRNNIKCAIEFGSRRKFERESSAFGASSWFGSRSSLPGRSESERASAWKQISARKRSKSNEEILAPFPVRISNQEEHLIKKKKTFPSFIETEYHSSYPLE